MKRRITVMLIVLAMLLGMMPGTASAATTISSVNILYDVADFQLYQSSIEKDVNNNITLKTNTTTTGVEIRREYSSTGLEYMIYKNTYSGTNTSMAQVDETRDYYMCIHLLLKAGNEWPAEIKQIAETKTFIPITELHAFRIFLNGERYYDNEGYVRLYSDNSLDISVPIANDITSITLSPASFTYDGKEKKPQVVSARLINGDPVNSRMYKVTYVNKDNRMVSPVNPGTYYVLLQGTGIYGTGRKAFTINKVSNSMTAQGKTVKIKASKLKKKKQVIKPTKSLRICNAVGDLKFKLAGVNKKKFKKYFKVNAKNGNITVKKGLKKGKYKLKIDITAAGNANYLAGTKSITVTVRVK